MTSVATARALRATGLQWEPARGDRFVIPDRDMDADVFVLSDMTIEAHDFPTGRVLGFNGTTEWALDSVDARQALWLPGEGQLRALLGDAFVRLERCRAAWSVTADGPGGATEVVDADVEEAYALALLAARARTAQALLPLAVHDLGARVRTLDAAGWSAQVPRTGPTGGSTARALVAALAAEHRWTADLLAGQDPRQVGSRYEEGVLGDDPVAGWDAAAGAALAGWAAADPARELVLPAGPTPVGDYAEQVLLDQALATWDLAVATGQDRRLQPAAVRAALAHLRPRAAQWSAAGVLAAPVDLGPAGAQGVHAATGTAAEQAELLALTGRDPR